VLEHRGCGIGPRQEVVDLAVKVSVDELGDDLCEVGLRLDADELAGLDQRGDDRLTLTLPKDSLRMDSVTTRLANMDWAPV
jgi:hypothetical protein